VRKGESMLFTNQVLINRSHQDVFDYLSRLENVPTWNYAIVETQKVSDGEVGVGTRYQQTRSLPTRSTEIIEITEFSPNERLALHGDLGPFTGTVVYELEPRDGGTQLTNTVDLEARGVLRLAAPVMSGRLRSAVAANLNKLKEILDSQPS
jgi:uncharacterized protein YndB with AHSA1/START domain